MLKNIERTLPCTLTDTEERERTEELLAKMAELEELAIQLDVSRANIKAQAGALEVRVRALRTILRDREELRAVECGQRADSADCLVSVVRLDTGARIQVRPMTEDERQQSLPFVGTQPHA